MEKSFSEILKGSLSRIQPTLYVKGFIASVNFEAWTADVQLLDGQTILRSVPLANSLEKLDVKVGDKCKIDLFDENNLDDIVVSYTYGRARQKTSNWGKVNLSANSSVTIQHGLGVIPDIVSISSQGYDNASGSSGIAGVYLYSDPTSNVIVIRNDNGVSINNVYWFVALV